MKVYVATKGEYSDYRIVGVFSTQDKADECISKLERPTSVIEYEVDEMASAKEIPVYRCYIELTADGKLVDLGSMEEFRAPRSVEVETYPASQRIYVSSAVSREHAEKVAIEKRQEWLRNQTRREAKGE